MLIDAFLKLRPFAYHTTALPNLERIRRTRTIESTSRLFELAGSTTDPRLCERRRGGLQLAIDGAPVSIRDQDPLNAGAIAFDPGWDLPRFVEYLNGFAFFWPGDEHAPIPYGRGHFARYLDLGEALAVMRVPTSALFEHNRARRILFSSVNSGSARMNQGLKQWRGEATFRSAEAFTCTPGQVKEIVVEGAAALPASAEFADSLAGPWRPL
jgi:hypothetical protein